MGNATWAIYFRQRYGGTHELPNVLRFEHGKTEIRILKKELFKEVIWLNKSKGDIWVPIQVDEVEDTDAFIGRLIKWKNDPSSEPELEKWYQYGEPKGLPFEVVKLSKKEVEFDIYYPMYLEAVELEEKQNKKIQALDIYLEILDSFTPAGTSYYERPIYLLEEKGDYTSAIKVCQEAIREIKNESFKASENEFLALKEGMENKLKRYGSNVFESRLDVLLNIIKSNPGINTKDLHTSLLNDEDWSGREVVTVNDYALDNGIIGRAKQGRSYSYFAC